ncbi:uncharacterized protein UTRI_04875_B [Ustilago trichophora]|uniref:Secreted protein n=1 Tax=Ustilago trichophora TaxID=86804 RepID=A0A5C3EI90_9BASI|nr:uncharacterized protein UTRI_04875_B [Ustilago trichophora]
MLWLFAVVALQLLTLCRAAPTSSASASERALSDERPSESSGEVSGEMSIPQGMRGRKRPTPPPPVLTLDFELSQIESAPKLGIQPSKRLSMGSPSQVHSPPYQTLMDDPTRLFDMRSVGQIQASSHRQHGLGPTSQLLASVMYPPHPPLPPAAWRRAATPGGYADWWLRYRVAHNGPPPAMFRVSPGSGTTEFVPEEYSRYAKRVQALDNLRK